MSTASNPDQNPNPDTGRSEGRHRRGDSSPDTPGSRNSAIDQIADAYLERIAAADPITGTHLGVGDHDHLLTDFSPEAVASRTADAQAVLDALSRAQIADDVDRVTVATMSDALGRQITVAQAGESVGEVNVIESPLQAVRDVFDVMATGTADERAAVLARVRAIPGSLDSAIEGLRYRLAHGPLIARRQVDLVAEQADDAPAAVRHNIDRALADAGSDAASLSAALDAAHADAAAAFARYAHALRTEAAPVAAVDDAVGIDRYRPLLGLYLSDDVDPLDAYAWGLDHLDSVVAEQKTLAKEVTGSDDVTAAMAALDADARYTMTDKHAFVNWMQSLADLAVADLGDTEFVIPEQLRRIECRLAPSSTGAIYYTAPSADLTRPGRMWWSVPSDQNEFHTWQETTTVFHEGVPGHHLQLGAAMISPELNRWRKQASFTSGHGEGWALYAERLMDELGRLTDPGDRMGMLDSQRLRAARVIVDIGVHCRLTAPESVGGGIWDADKAWQFLTDNVAMNRSTLRFELDRYLGWPGQAPSYALGQRVWREVRQAYLDAHPGHTRKDFHARALALGGVSLEVLRREMTRVD